MCIAKVESIPCISSRFYLFFWLLAFGFWLLAFELILRFGRALTRVSASMVFSWASFFY